MFLYGWNDTQSAWGPDHAKAHRFALAPLALEHGRAVRRSERGRLCWSRGVRRFV